MQFYCLMYLLAYHILLFGLELLFQYSELQLIVLGTAFCDLSDEIKCNHCNGVLEVALSRQQ